MPTYEYACSSCGYQWEEIQKISEPALDTCSKCNEKTAKRLISGGNFILKGGGWYADLYSSKPTKPAGGEPSGSAKTDAPAAAPSPSTSTAAPATSAPSGGGDSGGTSGGSSST